MRLMIERLFGIFFFILPLVFFPGTSEVFEFNKMVAVYLFTIFIVSAWLIQCVNKQRIIFRRTKLDGPLLIFLGSQALSTYFSIDPRTSMFGYYLRFHGGLLSIMCYSLLYWAYVSNVGEEATKMILRLILYSGALVAVWAIFEHYGYSISCLLMKGELNTACWEQDLRARVFATLGQPNWLAAYLAAIAPIGWVFGVKAKRGSIEYNLWLGIAFIFLMAILFTKSRSGLLGWAVAAGVFFWGKKRRKLIDVVLVILLAVGLAQIGRQQEMDTTGMLITPSSEIRKIVWRGAIDVWREYPIFGSGVETFGFSYFQKRPVAHNLTSEWNLIYNKAHNEYLNYLATTGIVGLGAYLVLMGTSLGVLRKERKLLAGYISLLVTNFFGFSVVATGLLFFLFPAMAITCRKR
jgi:putative inorganic carbon (HCO3(-)) transporter